MACCAFAVLLLVQMLAPLRAVRERLFGATPSHDPAVAWRPGTVPVRSSRRAARRWRPALLLLLAAEVTAFGGYLLLAPHEHGINTRPKPAESPAAAAASSIPDPRSLS